MSVYEEIVRLGKYLDRQEKLLPLYMIKWKIEKGIEVLKNGKTNA